jgi:DNA-binding LacI/PurR family transcriptional regulator
MTLGVLAAMQVQGIRVDDEVKIATHGNRGSSLLIGWEDKITVFEIDPNTIVTAMFSMLESLMSGDATGDQRVLIGPRQRGR